VPKFFWILVVSVVAFILVVRMFRSRRITVYEYQRGLRYQKGRFTKTLGPGQYWTSIFSAIVPLDIRPEFMTIQGARRPEL